MNKYKNKTQKSYNKKNNINYNKKSTINRTKKQIQIPNKYIVSAKLIEKEYTTIPIYRNIQSRLNKIFDDNVLAFVIAPSPQERKQLIKQIIGPYAISQLSLTARFYYIKPIINAIKKQIYTKSIPDMGTTVGKAIKKIQDFGYNVFIHGGTVRDIFVHKDPTDIDLVFDRDVQSLEPLCKKEGWPCSIIDSRTQYINLGEDKGISLEGDNLKGKFLVPMHNHETTINDFAFDCQTNILIDISGHGLEDIVYRKIRLSPLPQYWEKWASSDYMGKRPLRYFKLIQKGFKPRDDGSLEFVVNYIKKNFDTIYEKPIKPTYPIPRIKHFLIVNITMGKIDPETGVYEYGANEDKLIPYLKVLRRYIGKEYFYRIMAHFDEEDIKLFKDEEVITSMSRFIRSKKVIILRHKLLQNNKQKK